MAKLIIDVEVDGSGKLQLLSNQVDDIGHKAEKADKPFKNLGQTLDNINRKLQLAGAVVGTAALTAFTVAVGKTVRAGIEFNSNMETYRGGLVALALTVQDKSIPLSERLTRATKETTASIAALQEVNKTTPHTLGETVQIYKAMYVSMKNMGASNKEIIDITQKLSVAAGSAGIEFNSLLAGVDGLASGTVLANSDLGRFLSSLGLTNKALKSTSDVIGLVNEKLADFTGFDTLKTSVSNLTNSYDVLSGQLTEDIFSALKASIDETSLKISGLGDEDIVRLKARVNDLAAAAATVSIAMIKGLGGTIKILHGAFVMLENAWIGLQSLLDWDSWDANRIKVEQNRQSYINLVNSIDSATTSLEQIRDGFIKNIDTAAHSTKATMDQAEATKLLASHNAEAVKKFQELRGAEAKEGAEKTKLKKATKEHKEALKKANEEKKLAAKLAKEHEDAIKSEANALSKYNDIVARATMSEREYQQYLLGNELNDLGAQGLDQDKLAEIYRIRMDEINKNYPTFDPTSAPANDPRAVPDINDDNFFTNQNQRGQPSDSSVGNSNGSSAGGSGYSSGDYAYMDAQGNSYNSALGSVATRLQHYNAAPASLMVDKYASDIEYIFGTSGRRQQIWDRNSSMGSTTGTFAPSSKAVAPKAPRETAPQEQAPENYQNTQSSEQNDNIIKVLEDQTRILKGGLKVYQLNK